MSHFSRKSPLETPRPDAVSEREVKIQKIDTLDVDFPYNDGPSCWSGYEIRLEELIYLEKYPIHDLQSPKRAALLKKCQEELRETGCSLIKQFITPEAVAKMAAEGERLMKIRTMQKESYITPYLAPPEPEKYDKDHPRNFEQRRTQSFIDSHLLERDSSYRKIYDSDVFLHFISECVEERIYRWADPITRSVYSLQREGNELPWHFDRNEFTISLLVQEGLEGGKFEYAPMVRNVGGGKEGEEDYDAVRKIVKEGDRSKIKILDLCKGDIQIFRGRNTLHRVTPVEGERTRIIALPSYVKDPYSVGTAKQTDYFYGRHFPIHEERNKEAACANI